MSHSRKVVDLHLDQLLPVLLNPTQQRGGVRVLQGTAGLFVVIHHLGARTGSGRGLRGSQGWPQSPEGPRPPAYLCTDARHQEALPVVQHGLLQEALLRLALGRWEQRPSFLTRSAQPPLRAASAPPGAQRAAAQAPARPTVRPQRGRLLTSMRLTFRVRICRLMSTL